MGAGDPGTARPVSARRRSERPVVLQSVPSFLIDALTAVVGVLALARSGKAPSGTGLIRTSGTLPVMAALIVLGWRADTTVLLYDTLLLLPSADTASAAGPMPPPGPPGQPGPPNAPPHTQQPPMPQGAPGPAGPPAPLTPERRAAAIAAAP